MTQQRPTDEQLMAFADNALGPAETEGLARLIAADPALQDRVEMFRLSGALVREARGPFSGETVPDALRQSVEAMIAAANSAPGKAGNVVNFTTRKPAAPFPASRPWALPIAASLIAVLGGIGGYLLGQGTPGQTGASFAAVGSTLPGDIGDALRTVASGQSVGLAEGQLRAIATMRTKDGALCREFELDRITGQTVVGLGCRDNSAWRLDIAVAAPQSQDGFAPASSLNAIESYLGMIEAGEPLAPADELAALAQGAN